MFDWANSVYNLVITATIFPAYFESITNERKDATGQTFVHFAGREFVNTSLYNYTLGFALLVVALLLPLLTSIADYKGNKKKFMAFFFRWVVSPVPYYSSLRPSVFFGWVYCV